MAGRGRLSSIDLLPEDAADDVLWACQELYLNKRTQDEIRDDFNARLVAKGLDPISRSAFSRKAMRLSGAQRRMRDGRAMFEGLASEFTAQDVDQNTIVLGEFIKTLIQELVDDQSGLKDPKQAKELAQAYQATVSAQKISTDRRQKLENEFAQKTEKVIATVGIEAGLSAERIAQLRRDFLGVRDQPKKAGAA